MVIKTNMRLLTIQSNTARLALMGNGIYRPSWSWVGNDPDWASLYRMMMVAMGRRGLSSGGRPPVWAWPCERRYGGPLTLEAALFFLGGIERAQAAWMIEFDAPAHHCLLTCYRAWQTIVHSERRHRPPHLASIFTRQSASTGTMVHHDARPDPDEYQVCLSMLRREWIHTVRPLKSGASGSRTLMA